MHHHSSFIMYTMDDIMLGALYGWHRYTGAQHACLLEVLI
jgi:hypothetical protein